VVNLVPRRSRHSFGLLDQMPRYRGDPRPAADDGDALIQTRRRVGPLAYREPSKEEHDEQNPAIRLAPFLAGSLLKRERRLPPMRHIVYPDLAYPFDPPEVAPFRHDQACRRATHRPRVSGSRASSLMGGR